MRISKVPAIVLIALSLMGCRPLAANVEHTPLPPSQPHTGLKILFGSAERERYIVHQAPLSATNTYPVNKWFREKLTQWRATKPPTAEGSATLKITLRHIDTDLDALGDDDSPWGLSGRAAYPTYVSVHKTVRLHLTASLQKPGEAPCTQDLTGRATDQRSLWISQHPFHSAYDFKQTFHSAIDDAIRQLEGWSCGQ